MSDSTIPDITKMKVVDLRKELKSRGLSYAGDKAELMARLQAAVAQDDHGDINLDSDEIDSDGVLEYDDKSQPDILDDTGVDTLNEELALSDQSPEKQVNGQPKPQKALKRKAVQEASKEESDEKVENKETVAKKIVLNRNIAVTTTNAKASQENTEDTPKVDSNGNSNKVKITANMDPKTRLEMRAKRFGLPVKLTEEERKEARKQRFGQNTSSTNITSAIGSGTLASNVEKLKQRAERFGQSVSAIMTDIEKKEKLEKRKAKFGTVK